MRVLPLASILSLGDDLLPTVPVFLEHLQALEARRSTVMAGLDPAISILGT